MMCVCVLQVYCERYVYVYYVYGVLLLTSIFFCDIAKNFFLLKLLLRMRKSVLIIRKFWLL